MSTKTGKDANPTEAADDEEREGGLLPAILAGAGILAVVGLLVFWPSGDDAAADGRAKSAQKEGKNGKGGRAGAGADGKSGPGAQGGGGVAARSVDEATPGASAAGGRVNSRFSPRGIGMAPAVPQEEPPPKFDNVEEEITWYEGKLERANSLLDTRKKNVKRLSKMKENAENSPNPSAALAKYESSKAIVEKNLAKAEAKVAELEQKIAELGG